MPRLRTNHSVPYLLATTLCLSMLLVLGCSSSSPTEPEDPNSAASLRRVAGQLSAGGTTFVAFSFVRRNTNPTSPTTDLIQVTLRVKPLPWVGGPGPGSAETLFLVHGDEVWSTTQLITAEAEFGFRFISARGGPRWPIGDSVDAVVEFRGTDGVLRRLRAPTSVIEGES